MKTYAYFLMSPSKKVHCLGGMNTVNVHHNIVSYMWKKVNTSLQIQHTK